jgi:hypothetical protein
VDDQSALRCERSTRTREALRHALANEDATSATVVDLAQRIAAFPHRDPRDPRVRKERDRRKRDFCERTHWDLLE